MKRLIAEENLLTINDLKVIYKTEYETVHAVNGINFSIKKGETLGIVGETGAGKTTTALAIMQLLPMIARTPEGSIQFESENILALPEKDILKIRGKRIAMIFQDPMTSLNPIMNIGDQIAEALLLHSDDHSRKYIDGQVDQVLQMVGISPERKHDYPHQMSGGMKQRVVIAMALVCKPELLIADEPTTALDVTIQAQVLAMMRELRDKLGTAMIMITHNLGIVAQICDKVAVMYAGEIIESGTMEEIFVGEMHHPYTKGLFGSLPNLTQVRDRLEPIDGLMPDPTDLPAGCSFFPRCPRSSDICQHQKPAGVSYGSHSIRCHLFNMQELRKRKK